MEHIRIVFFGSTTDSVLVLEKLFTFHFSLFTPRICAVVTQPPRPVGRRQIFTPTPVAIRSKAHGLTVLSFSTDPMKPWLYKDEQQVIATLQPLKADILISACYGQRIPWETIKEARFGGLNVHPSLLPRWRGADPVPWAILSADHQTGVTVVTLSKEFDQGAIIAQKKIPIADTDTSDPLRTKLFTIGADLLLESLDSVIASKAFTLEGKQSHINMRSPRPAERGLAMTTGAHARRLTRNDGFEPWEAIEKSFTNSQEAVRIDRKFRALHPWPGLWTEIVIRDKREVISKTKKRMKIISVHLSPITHHLSLDSVQIEGKKPAAWKQFRDAYLSGPIRMGLWFALLTAGVERLHWL